MIKLKAKFIGKSSLGFISNNTYDLKLDVLYNNKTLIIIKTDDKNQKLRCEYNSWKRYKENWIFLSCDKSQINRMENPMSRYEINVILPLILCSIRSYKLNLLLK